MSSASDDQKPHTLPALRKYLLECRAAWGSWEQVRRREYPAVPRGTLHRIAHDAAYEPRRAPIRAALGLPVFAPAPVCAVHGRVCIRHCRPAPPAWVRQAADWLAGRIMPAA